MTSRSAHLRSSMCSTGSPKPSHCCHSSSSCSHAQPSSTRLPRNGHPFCASREVCWCMEVWKHGSMEAWNSGAIGPRAAFQTNTYTQLHTWSAFALRLSSRLTKLQVSVLLRRCTRGPTTVATRTVLQGAPQQPSRFEGLLVLYPTHRCHLGGGKEHKSFLVAGAQCTLAPTQHNGHGALYT